MAALSTLSDARVAAVVRRHCKGPELWFAPSPCTRQSVHFTKRFPRSVPTAISSLCAVQQVFLLVSVSFISSCACVGLLYRSSMCACVTFIRFVFREQKILQRMQEIVAKYEDHLRQMQSVLRLSYRRWLVCTDGAPNRVFLTCLFCHHELAVQFLKDVGLIRSKVQCKTWHGMVPHNTDHF